MDYTESHKILSYTGHRVAEMWMCVEDREAERDEEETRSRA